MQRSRQCLGVLAAVFLICATLTLPNTTKLALAIGGMSTDYTEQKAALLNVKTVASSSGGKGSPTTTTSTTTSATRIGTIPKVILYWGTNNANSETLNARYVEYPSVFANSDSSSTTPTLINKNPNFAFTVVQN